MWHSIVYSGRACVSEAVVLIVTGMLCWLGEDRNAAVGDGEHNDDNDDDDDDDDDNNDDDDDNDGDDDDNEEEEEEEEEVQRFSNHIRNITSWF